MNDFRVETKGDGYILLTDEELLLEAQMTANTAVDPRLWNETVRRNIVARMAEFWKRTPR